MERKRYIRDIYSTYWLTARENIYGFPTYDQNLCNLILESLSCPSDSTTKPPRLLEVASGTGYPFADFLQRAGLELHGIDLAPQLVEKCRKLYPKVNVRVGDAENIEYENDTFDLTYCFHATWLFPQLLRVIDEMVRVTKAPGKVLFDIMNLSNPLVHFEYQRHVAKGRFSQRLLHFIYCARQMLRGCRPCWARAVYETPTDPKVVVDHLRSKRWRFQLYRRNEGDQSIQKLDPGDEELSECARLVFRVDITPEFK